MQWEPDGMATQESLKFKYQISSEYISCGT